jgi:hypothetical protein
VLCITKHENEACHSETPSLYEKRINNASGKPGAWLGKASVVAGLGRKQMRGAPSAKFFEIA